MQNGKVCRPYASVTVRKYQPEGRWEVEMGVEDEIEIEIEVEVGVEVEDEIEIEIGVGGEVEVEIEVERVRWSVAGFG
jgi:hypothetical protein